MIDQKMGRYRATINRGGSLIADTKRFLVNWDDSLDAAGNSRRAVEQNVLAKRSRTQTQEVLYAIRARYLQDESIAKGLVALARSPLQSEALDRLLYYFTAKADPIVYDTVLELAQPRLESGFSDLSLDRTVAQVREWVRDGRTQVAWSDETTERVAQGILAALRDFGILEGKVHKQIAPPFLPDAAFALIAFLIHKETRSGEKTVEHPDWRLFFLDRTAVQRFFVAAHQLHYLTYAAAGNVIRIDFPAGSFEEEVNVVIARTH